MCVFLITGVALSICSELNQGLLEKARFRGTCSNFTQLKKKIKPSQRITGHLYFGFFFRHQQQISFANAHKKRNEELEVHQENSERRSSPTAQHRHGDDDDDDGVLRRSINFVAFGISRDEADGQDEAQRKNQDEFKIIASTWFGWNRKLCQQCAGLAGWLVGWLVGFSSRLFSGLTNSTP